MVAAAISLVRLNLVKYGFAVESEQVQDLNVLMTYLHIN